jgi:hypothetical protein
MFVKNYNQKVLFIIEKQIKTQKMETQTIYHLALVTHIIAITMIAGTTLIDYVIFKQFSKQMNSDRQKGITIIEALSKLPMLFGIGFILIIISGVYMMYVTNGAFGEQTWFRIKFALILLIVINGLAVGRRQGVKLRNTLSGAGDVNIEENILKVSANLSLFHLSQMTMLVIIFVLSVFKFN